MMMMMMMMMMLVVVVINMNNVLAYVPKVTCCVAHFIAMSSSSIH